VAITMSIEYFTYSTDPRPITIEELTADLTRQGWAAVVTRGRVGRPGFSIDECGPLGDGSDIFAAGLDDAGAIAALVAVRDSGQAGRDASDPGRHYRCRWAFG
jgi:hypothetical protein